MTLRFLISFLLPSMALAQKHRAEEPAASPTSAPTTAKAPAHELVPTKETVDDAAEQKIADARPYKLQGRGSDGKIVDAAGQVVLEGDPKVGIYGGTASPDGKSVLVYYGDANYEILNPVTKERLRLPSEPPGKNKLGFGFYWIDNDTLLGASGDLKLDRRGQPVRDDDNVARTRLYLYHLANHTLEELKIPVPPDVKQVFVSSVTSTGLIHLMHDDPGSKRPEDLGWFKARAQSASRPK